MKWPPTTPRLARNSPITWVAGTLDVAPAALYWHVKNKQELLDAMAIRIYADAVDGLEGPRAGVA